MKKKSPFSQLNFTEIHKKELDLLKELAHFKLSQDASALKTPGGHSKLRRLVREVARVRAQTPRVEEGKVAAVSPAASAEVATKSVASQKKVAVASDAAPKAVKKPVAKKSTAKATAKSAGGVV
jgi:ribosomal protein L29